MNKEIYSIHLFDVVWGQKYWTPSENRTYWQWSANLACYYTKLGGHITVGGGVHIFHLQMYSGVKTFFFFFLV